MAKTTKPAKREPAPVSPAPDGTSDYIVSDNAPPRVAGRRVVKGQTIRLSEAEARGELLALHILLAGVPETAPEGNEN